jgi:hypothetical protein
MTKRQVAVLLIALAALLVPAVGVAVWDAWLVRNEHDDTISWSFAMLTVYHPFASHAFAAVLGMIFAGLLIHFTYFVMPEPSIFAALNEARAENAELKRRLAEMEAKT